MLEKITRMALLQDFYGPLLTEKQRRMMSLYFDDNLSLAEIAEEFEVSRQAVHDLLRRTEKALEEYEERLGLVARHQKERELLRQARICIEKGERDKALAIMDSIEALGAGEGGDEG